MLISNNELLELTLFEDAHQRKLIEDHFNIVFRSELNNFLI